MQKDVLPYQPTAVHLKSAVNEVIQLFNPLIIQKQLTINQNYDNKHNNRQKINLLSLCEHGRYVQHRNVTMSINEMNIIRGKIVKVMMIRRKIHKSGLLNLVMCELSKMSKMIRSITYENIKECITSLIKQEYIMCDSDGIVSYLV